MKKYEATIFKKSDMVIECEANSKEEAIKKISKIISKNGIALMVKEKEKVLNNTEKKPAFIQTEFSQKQINQIDCIDNSVHDLCSILLDMPNLNWDMNMIGDVADAVANVLAKKGYKVYYPALIEDIDGEPYVVDLYNNYAYNVTSFVNTSKIKNHGSCTGDYAAGFTDSIVTDENLKKGKLL